MDLKYSYWWFKSAISPEDCEKIISLGESRIKEEESLGNPTYGETVGNREKQSVGDAIPLNETPQSDLTLPVEKTYIRDSQVAWLNDKWLYNLIVPYVKSANQNAYWNWDIDYHESFQFTKYNVGGFYGWHKDGKADWDGAYKRYIHGITEVPLKNNKIPHGWTTNENFVGKIRKISLTINLNKPGEYEGGNLKFDFGNHTKRENRFHECEEIRPQGSMVIFPSFLDHCVTPVTKGTRYSLVLWSLGAPWK